MHWALLALIGPILWAIGNHIDKFLIEKYFKAKGTGVLLMFSSLIGVIVLPILFFIKPEVLDIGNTHAIVLVIAGIAEVIIFWLYFKALEHEEASVVVPFYQLVPVFAYVFGYFVLGEILTNVQILAMILIISGASVLSIEIDEENKFKLRKNTAFLMTLVALISAAESVVFKYIILEENFWVSTFWFYSGLAFIGIMMFIFSHKLRKEFLSVWKINSKKIIGINVINEFLTIIGNVTFSFAYLFAPIAVVLLFNSYQPIFVFAIGIILTLFFPKIGMEKIKAKHLLQKIFVIAIMGVGTYLLFI